MPEMTVNKLLHEEQKKKFLADLARIKGDEIGDRNSQLYVWLSDNMDLAIYLDDRFCFMDVRYRGSFVCSTHPDSGMPFIEGEWWGLVEPYTEEINSIVDAEENTKTVMMAMAI